MASSVTYHLGGFVPAAPQQNRAELYDGAAGTYTSWDTSGVQTASRPLTAAEAAQLAADDAAIVADTNRGTLQSRAQAALTANAAFVAAAKPGTAAAQASAAYDQAVRVTKECSALIRLALNLLDDTTGT